MKLDNHVSNESLETSESLNSSSASTSSSNSTAESIKHSTTGFTTKDLRNIAIIAHVDHGKTTLVDGLLRQGGAFRDNLQVSERVMDSNDLEKERGITILAKCTSIFYDKYKINIIDTPGHADFGGEVERILNMVDCVLLLVDAAEGVKPQTKFVLTKALNMGLRPIVVINKVDRPDARIEEVIDEIEELFVSLDPTDEQLDFPKVYASGREGWASLTRDTKGKDLKPLFETIISYTPAPNNDIEAPFTFVPSLLDVDPYIGRILIGKVNSGRVRVNMQIKALDLDGQVVELTRANKLLGFEGLDKVATDYLTAGDIGIIAGFKKATIGHTICDPIITTPLKTTPIDPPIISICFGVNTSPLAGTEGKNLTSNQIRDRLYKEAEKNVSITVKDSPDRESFEVYGRGELQLGILIENMRREGFELTISRPKVVMNNTSGVVTEPIEEVFIDVDEAHVGPVIEKLSLRKGELQDMKSSGGGKTSLRFYCPSRGLIGYLSELLTDTKGTAVINRLFHEYGAYRGEIESRTNGVLISNGLGDAVDYALFNLQDRGEFFVSGGEKIYQGMIIGEHSRENDLEINALKGKQLTNMRASGKDEAIKLSPPRKISLEYAMSYIQDDEVLEVTPKSIRLRKKFLDPNDRKRGGKK